MKRLPEFFRSKRAYVVYVVAAALLLGVAFYFAPSRRIVPVFDGVYASLEIADRLVAQEDFDGAISELKNYLESEELEDFERQQALNRLAEIYAQQGNHNRALDTYLQLEELEEELSFGTAMGVFGSAWALNDTKLALKYLEAARELLEEQEGDYVEELEEQIAADLATLKEITGSGPTGIYEADVLLRRGEIAEEFNDTRAASAYYQAALKLIEPELPKHELPDGEEEVEVEIPRTNIEIIADDLREKIDAFKSES